MSVPDPARFVLHKPLVYGERKGAFASRSAKDLAQGVHARHRTYPDLAAAELLRKA